MRYGSILMVCNTAVQKTSLLKKQCTVFPTKQDINAFLAKVVFPPGLVLVFICDGCAREVHVSSSWHHQGK